MSIRKPHTVIVYGQAPEIVEMIGSFSENCINLAEHTKSSNVQSKSFNILWKCNDKRQTVEIPLSNRSVDHFLAPICNFHDPVWALSEIVRILKPGGQILLGLLNDRYWLHPLVRLIYSQSRHKFGDLLFMESVLAVLGDMPIKITHSFGVYKSLFDLRYLVSLGEPGPSDYIFNHVLSPFSWQNQLEIALSKYLLQRLGQKSMFRSVCLLCKKI